jgi:hypothetical protein
MSFKKLSINLPERILLAQIVLVCAVLLMVVF